MRTPKRSAWLWLGVCGLALAAPVWADAPPHTSYTTQTKSATVTADSTDTALWTPLSGSRFALQGCKFSSPVAALLELEVSDVDVVPPQYLESYGDSQVGGVGAPIYTSATDAVLRYTVTFTGYTPAVQDERASLVCWGYEYRQ